MLFFSKIPQGSFAALFALVAYSYVLCIAAGSVPIWHP